MVTLHVKAQTLVLMFYIDFLMIKTATKNFLHTTSCYGAFVSLCPPCTCTPHNASKLCTSLVLSALTQLYLHFSCSTFDFHFVLDTTHFTFNICNFLQTTGVAHHCSCSTGSVLTSCINSEPHLGFDIMWTR
jgi:hypothetical protein